MPNAKNICGLSFGRLTAFFPNGQKDRNRPVWLCLCECGNYKPFSLMRLRTTKSCGCYALEVKKAQAVKYFSIPHPVFKKHGLSETQEYYVWRAMKQRCARVKNQAYKNYGGRGITVCERWKNDFASFLEDMGPRPPGLTIERVDNDGNYEPSNCVWATRSEQAKNKRRPKTLNKPPESFNRPPGR